MRHPPLLNYIVLSLTANPVDDPFGCIPTVFILIQSSGYPTFSFIISSSPIGIVYISPNSLSNLHKYLMNVIQCIKNIEHSLPFWNQLILAWCVLKTHITFNHVNSKLFSLVLPWSNLFKNLLFKSMNCSDLASDGTGCEGGGSLYAIHDTTNSLVCTGRLYWAILVR